MPSAAPTAALLPFITQPPLLCTSICRRLCFYVRYGTADKKRSDLYKPHEKTSPRKTERLKNHLISDIKSRGFRVVMLSGARLKTYSISGFLSTVQTDTESPRSCITSTKAFDKYVYLQFIPTAPACFISSAVRRKYSLSRSLSTFSFILR